MSTTRITWEPSPLAPGSERGMVDAFRLFGTYWGNGGYRLTTALPLHAKSMDKSYSTQQEAHDVAERILANFLRRVGGAA